MKFYDDKNPECLKSYITYMDILGYTNMILEEKDENLLNVYHAINNTKSILKSTDMNVTTDTIVKMFSDNIIAASPVSLKNEENMFCKFRHIYQASRFQFCLCLHGFFIRGGFAVDNLYIDNNIVFGNGILKAYHLEDKIAVYPRIVVDENTYRELCKTDSIVPIDKCIRKDHDGNLFVDFLNVLYINEVVLAGYYIDYENCLQNLFWEQLLNLQDVIIRKIEIYKNDTKVRSKYEWSANYLKEFCLEKYPEKKLKY